MAWISVHDHVDGKKLRRMSKMLNCSKAEALGILNFLWFWGLNNADENGRIEDADRDDIAEVLSGKTQLPLDEVVTALFNSGWLDDVEGCIYLHDWSDWQEQWYKFRKKKDYDAKRKRLERPRNKGDHEPDPPPQEEPQVDRSQDPVEDAGEQPKKPAKPKPEKKKYAEFVSLTEAEYQKLVERFGDQVANMAIEILDNYKGANPKKRRYESDYRAILNWVVKRVKEENPQLFRNSANPGSGRGLGYYDPGDTEGSL